jgi:hypothetical protein
MTLSWVVTNDLALMQWPYVQVDISTFVIMQLRGNRVVIQSAVYARRIVQLPNLVIFVAYSSEASHL